MLIIISLAVVVGAMAFIRFAPSDPTKWHVDPGTITPTECDHLTVSPASARVTCLRPDVPSAMLAKLDGIALSSPRTIRLAGSAETGRITWVSRSPFWGFPDYVTAQAVSTPDGTRLDIVARARFGASDLGVNAERLTRWLALL